MKKLTERMEEALRDLTLNGARVETWWQAQRKYPGDEYFHVAPYRRDTLEALEKRGLIVGERMRGRPTKWRSA